MNGNLQDLRVHVISAINAKPYALYNIQVENVKTNQQWIVRRCFHEFRDLKAKFKLLVEGFDFDQRKQFPLLYKEFPKRPLFGSKTKWVLHQRASLLEEFLHQLMDVVKQFRDKQQVAICFSLMNNIEGFLDCSRQSQNKNKQTLCMPPPPPPLMLPMQPRLRGISSFECSSTSSGNNETSSDTSSSNYNYAMASALASPANPKQPHHVIDLDPTKKSLYKAQSCILSREVAQNPPIDAAPASATDEAADHNDSLAAWRARIQIAGLDTSILPMTRRRARTLSPRQSQDDIDLRLRQELFGAHNRPLFDTEESPESEFAYP